MNNVYFESILKKYNAKLIKNESSWFNGKIHMPLNQYIINFNYNNWITRIVCEVRVSEFNRKQFVDGGLFKDRYLYEIDSSRVVENELMPKFRIFESSLFSKFFFTKQNYTLECKNSKAYELLNKNSRINAMFGDIDDGEYSPYIMGSYQEGKYHVNLKFNLKNIDSDAVLLSLTDDLFFIIGLLSK